MLLTKASDGIAGVLFLPYRATAAPGRDADHPVTEPVLRAVGGVGGLTRHRLLRPAPRHPERDILVAKEDPGQGIVWLAFLSLITGLLITFYLPRRRVWARIDPDGELRIVGRSERYVDFRREFGAVRRRRPARPAAGGRADRRAVVGCAISGPTSDPMARPTSHPGIDARSHQAEGRHHVGRARTRP